MNEGGLVLPGFFGFRLGKSLREKSHGEHIHADVFFFGPANKTDVQTFRNPEVEFSTGLYWFARLWDGITELLRRGKPGPGSVFSIFNRFFDGFSVGHTTGQIGKGDEPALTFFFGQFTDFERIIKWFHVLFLKLNDHFQKFSYVYRLDWFVSRNGYLIGVGITERNMTRSMLTPLNAVMTGNYFEIFNPPIMRVVFHPGDYFFNPWHG
jgi:hypothetical protein